MRKINLGDVFKTARIIKQAKVKDALMEIFEKSQSTTTSGENTGEDSKKKEAVGFQAIMTVLEACCTEELEGMLYELLGGITEKKPEDIKHQSLEKTVEELKEIAKENNLLSFFEEAVQLTE